LISKQKYMSDSKEGFVQAYHDILTHAGPAFLPIYQYLAKLPPPSSQSQPKDSSIGALIHCTAGKDRTGMFFGILFSYLGVPASSIAAEYQLTELGLGHMREEIVSRIIQTPGIQAYMLSQNSSQEGGPSEGEQKQISPEALEKGRQAALRMMSARKESMEGALELVDREWGSAEGYLRNVVGLSDGELEGLRRCLVVNA
jgi:protein tyrosine/serine phosphatase